MRRKRNNTHYTPKYADAVVAEGKGLAAGLHHIVVQHDDHCEMVKGGSVCTCDPEVSEPVANEDYQRRN